MYRIFLILVFLFTLNVQAQSTLPAVKIRDFSGKDVLFDSTIAKGDTVTVVSFWATWCTPCITELDAINDQLPGWKKNAQFKFIALSVDDNRTIAMVRPLVKGKGWDFAFYTDANSQLKRALNVNDIPHTLIIKHGRIVYQHTGYISGDEDELFARLKSL